MKTATVQKRCVQDSILEWLNSHPEGAFADDIARGVGLDPSNAAAHLKLLTDAQELVRCKSIKGATERWFYRLSATAGAPQKGVRWRNFTVAPGRTPPRIPEHRVAPPEDRPAVVPAGPLAEVRGEEGAAPGRSPGPPGGAASGPAVSAPVRPAPAPAGADGNSLPSTISEALQQAGERARHASKSAAAAEPVNEPGAILAFGSAAAAAAASAREERARYGEPFRCALYSDGTLILEGLPRVAEPIIAIEPQHARALIDYLRGQTAWRDHA